MSSYYLYNTAVSGMGLTKSTYAVYHVLASAADNKTRQCWMKNATIAERIKTTPKTVQRAVKALVNAGLLRVKAQFRKNGKQGSNLFTLLDEPQTKMEQQPIVDQSKSQMKRIDSEVASESYSDSSLNVYCYLKAHSNREGFCYTSLKKIATKLKKSTRTVQRHLHQLLQKGILTVKRVEGDQNIYQLGKTPEKAPVVHTPCKQNGRRNTPFLEVDHKIMELYYTELSESIITPLQRILFLRNT